MRRLFLRIIICSIISLSFIPMVPFSNAQTNIPNRNQVVWATGYWQTASSLNPWNSNPAYGIVGMYETLFGYNAVTGKVIPIIGTNYYWNPLNDSQCIVNLNPKAKWSDGTPISSEDVIFSYKIVIYNASNFASDMQAQIQDVVKINSTAIMFITKPAFHHTGFLDVWLTTNIPIVPKNIWEQILINLGTNAPTDDLNAINESLDAFTNDWFNPLFNSSWKVASGPYFPYYRSDSKDIEIYRLNPTYWGSGVINTDLPNTQGKPQVEYIGLNHYASNEFQDAALSTGYIDYFSGYYANIWNLMADNPHINSWYGQNVPYELGINSMVELVPNNQMFPFSCQWLRQALAWDIDYLECSETAASGYLTRAKQGFADNISAQLTGVYNDTIQKLYGISNINKSIAQSILEVHATHNSSGWWTNPNEANNYIGFPVAGQKNTFVQANTSYLIGNTNPSDGYAFQIICPSGWSDVEIAMKIAAKSFSEDLNISTCEQGISYNEYITKFQNGNFTLGMMCASPGLNNNPVIFFNGYRGNYIQGSNYPYNRNTSRWVNPVYEEAFQDFMIETPGSDRYKEAASIMQYELATQIPSIPFYGNGYWYAYSDQYWVGWNSNSTQYQQITTVFDNTNFALRNREILNLSPANTSVTLTLIQILQIGTIIAAIGLVFTMIIMRQRYMKKMDELSKLEE